MNSKRLLPLCGLICATAMLGACVGQGSSNAANESMYLEQRVQEHDTLLRQMQPAQAEVWNQVQAMRQELNALKGLVDDLKNVGGAAALAERVRAHDAALRQVETSMALNLNLGEPMAAGGAAPAHAAAPQANAPLFQPQQTPYAAPAAGAAAGAAAGLATGPYGDAAAAPAAAPAAAGSTWGQPTPQPEAKPAAKKDISLALYDAGLNAFQARKYDEAQRSFADFMKNYPTHSMAPDAQYYLAECYFQRNQFPDAALAYDTVITKFSKSNRTPGAYLRQGICFSKMNQKAAAKARMNELIKKYPNSPEAARAKNFLKTNK